VALRWAIADEHVKIIVQTGRGKYYTTGWYPDGGCVLIIGMDLSPDFLDERPAAADTFGTL
jgi:hypothetical protein